MSKPARHILVTSALPYANGDIHIGHLVEYIQTDIWVRFQKLIGNHCVYVCADDTHGTPIMLSAKRQGITPESLIDTMSQNHQRDFSAFHIEFDNYGSTNSPENKALSESIYLAAKDADAIDIREIEQAYCSTCEMFLPDRFIRGTCPKCSAPDQYGDGCEVCSSTYSPTDLLEPKCAECDNPPIQKSSEHHFFKLAQFESQLKNWIQDSNLRDEIKNKLKEWFTEGLKDWDISRDAPYFGFKIPGTEDKYFYVWLDAPVGYMASTQQWCDQNSGDFDTIWKNGDYEIHHFIGKDIMYFHTLFWPAMLMVSGYKLPTRVNVHGFLTVNGQKMSKSRGTFVLAQKYLAHLDPVLLRYYFASKLSGSLDDIDLSLDDFVYRVNSDVINKVINIGSRLGSIVKKRLELQLSTPDDAGAKLLERFKADFATIQDHYETLAYHKAMRAIMALADDANKYIDDAVPWDVVKTDPDRARQICTTGLNALKVLAILLSPVIPPISEKIFQFLNLPAQNWENLNDLITDHTINPYEHIAQRIDLNTAENILH